MINKGEWRESKRGNMPPNRRKIDSKLVFKKKRYGQFRARLVARGYNLIVRGEFTKNYSPVVTDVTLCIIIIIWFINKWYSLTIHVETVFLIHNTRGRNLHKDTRRNIRSTWRILCVQRYIDTNKIYPRSRTSITLLVQGIHQYYYPQGGFQRIQDLPLSIIYSKWTQ